MTSMERIISIASRVRRAINRRKKRDQATAIDRQYNDFYVVEFPKSGITWLSSMLANMALIASGRKEVASFTAAHLYVPDIHISRHIGPVPYDIPPVRFIKSHSEFNDNYVFVIYLVRHPLSVMKSFYRFMMERRQDVADFDAFCRSSFGIRAWKRHVNSWLTGGTVSQRLHLCRYEDFVDHPCSELEILVSNFGWDIDLSAIERAVEYSTAKNMKESESLYRSKNPRYKEIFVRGSNDFEIQEDTLRYIHDECRDELKLLGYDSLENVRQTRTN